VAYEPRWAIGTGVPCEPSDVAAMHAKIRTLAGADAPILYGGSVDPKNFTSYLSLQDVDGLLSARLGAPGRRPRVLRSVLLPDM